MGMKYHVSTKSLNRKMTGFEDGGDIRVVSHRYPMLKGIEYHSRGREGVGKRKLTLLGVLYAHRSTQL
jgi:hypothetical protein